MALRPSSKAARVTRHVDEATPGAAGVFRLSVTLSTRMRDHAGVDAPLIVGQS
jgi:hypothetical protein